MVSICTRRYLIRCFKDATDCLLQQPWFMWPSSPRIIGEDAAVEIVQELYNFQSDSQSDRDPQIYHFGSVYWSNLHLHVAATHVIITIIVHCYLWVYDIIKMENSGAVEENYTTFQISVRVAEITKFVTLIVLIRASLLICSCCLYNHCCCCPLLLRILWYYQLIYKNCRFYWKCISYKNLENLVIMHLFLWYWYHHNNHAYCS